MIDAEGTPRVIEFNVRFGDPETQALVLQIEGDLVPLLDGAARGPPRARRAARGRRRRGLRGARLGRLPARLRDGQAHRGPRGGRGRAATWSCSTPARRARAASFVTAGGRVLGVSARAGRPARGARARLRRRRAHPLRRLPLPPRHRGPRAPMSEPAVALAPGLETALAWLAGDGLLAYPTETVWGLGAPPRRAPAPSRACARGRDAATSSPSPSSCRTSAALEALGARALRGGAGPRRGLLARAPHPRAALPRRASRRAIAGRGGAVGFRCSPASRRPRRSPRAAFARGLGPLTATSLNRSGEPPARTRAEAAALCKGDAAPQLLEGPWPDAGGDAPSSVVDLSRRRAAAWCARARSPPRALAAARAARRAVTDVAPFRALRYDPARVDLARVLVPPYDVIAPGSASATGRAIPTARIRLELTRDVADEAADRLPRRGRAPARLAGEGVLVRDAEPALYVLRQRFADPSGRELRRVGFFGALRLEDYARRVVPPPRAHAARAEGRSAPPCCARRRANLSAVFLLYEDPENELGPRPRGGPRRGRRREREGRRPASSTPSPCARRPAPRPARRVVPGDRGPS